MPNEIDQIMKNFWPSNWKCMSEEQKVMSCQDLENYLAGESGRRPFRVEHAEHPNANGATLMKEGLIQINVRKESSFEVLETLAHESAHADQNQMFKKRTKALTNKRVMMKYTKELEQKGLSDNDILVMQWEDDNYCSGQDSISLIGDGKLYKMQLMETDAVLRAAQFIKKHCGLMGDEIESIDTGMPNVYNFCDFNDFTKLKERKSRKIKINYFMDEKRTKQWFDDRLNRFESTDRDKYSDTELDQLKSIYRHEIWKKAA